VCERCQPKPRAARPQPADRSGGLRDRPARAPGSRR
jgi:hypothetical protein